MSCELGQLPVMDSDLLAVVVDPGSDTVKAGLNVDDYPRVIMQDIGPDRKKPILYMKNWRRRDGKECKPIKEENKVTAKPVVEPVVYKHPIEHGLVVNWDIMEEVYRHLFDDKLRIDTSEYKILITEVPLNPKYLRERLTQLMFEKFQVPGFHLKDTSSLSLFRTGRTTGVVLASGDAVTTTAVVHEGSVMRNTIPKTFYAGQDHTFYLKQLLTMKGNSSEWIEHGHILRDIKEKSCFVSQDFERDFKLAQKGHAFEFQYTLPDGSQLMLNEERFLCGEALFQPQLFDCSCPGIQHQIHRSIQFSEAKDPNLSTLLWPNIVIAGGNTMYPGIGKRLATEVNKICPASANVKISERTDRQHAAWIGGTLYSLMDTTHWISRQEYDEYGAKIVNKKCF